MSLLKIRCILLFEFLVSKVGESHHQGVTREITCCDRRDRVPEENIRSASSVKEGGSGDSRTPEVASGAVEILGRSDHPPCNVMNFARHINASLQLSFAADKGDKLDTKARTCESFEEVPYGLSGTA